MININFKSNVDFSNDIEKFPMTNYQVLKKEGRLVKMMIPPLSIIDNWDGKDLTVQSVIWDGCFFDMNMNEDQINMLPIISSCKDIYIEDTENNISVILDNSAPEYLIFEVGEKIGMTANYKVNVTFRTNKKVINLKTATENLYYIKVNSTFYYTDNTVIPRVLDSLIEMNQDNNGLDKASTSDYKKALKFVFYKNAVDRNLLKADFEGVSADNITCNDGTTTYQVLENVNIIDDSDPIGEDIYRMVVECVIDADRIYF